jgi:hypothetical protein
MLAGAVVAGFGQSGLTLSALTVPAASLPSGCALTQPAARPAASAQVGATVIEGTARSDRSSFPTNPWSGADRTLAARIRGAIDATPQRPLPDLPAFDPRDVEASKVKWTENIREAYHAAYTSAYGDQIEVFAVTFDDAKFAEAPESVSAVLNPPRGFSSRFVRGATVVRVAGSAQGECARAVDRYVRSLK